jgi:AcrR family transcriptional regulator
MPGRPATKAPLSRDRVLRTALALVDERGLEALSMRKLAAELGVEAMSLYNHVENKDDIVAGILDLVAAEIEFPAAERDWRAALRARTVAAHQAFVRRPWAARVWMTAAKMSDSRLEQADAVLRCLRDAGLSNSVIYRAYHALDGYALGYALQRLDFSSFAGEELERMARDFLDALPREEYPDFALHVEHHLDPAFASADSFEFGLDLILDGLDRLREDRPG